MAGNEVSAIRLDMCHKGITIQNLNIFRCFERAPVPGPMYSISNKGLIHNTFRHIHKLQ